MSIKRRTERMLGGNLPVSAPLQSYSKLDYMFEMHLVSYTETNQEEQEKRGLIKRYKFLSEKEGSCKTCKIIQYSNQTCKMFQQ